MEEAKTDQVYLFSVEPTTPPTIRVNSGDEVNLLVRGSLDDIKDIRDVPTPFTPACEGHPLAPITGPIAINGAEPGDVVTIDFLEITPQLNNGVTAILRGFGVLWKQFPNPKSLSCPVYDGKAWFGGRIPLPLTPNLGTIATMPTKGYKPSYAGPYGGDFDQKDSAEGNKVHLPVMVSDALVFFADPHASISDGAISGAGVECSAKVRARLILHKQQLCKHPIIENEETIQFVGTGSSVEEATECAAEYALSFTIDNTGLTREEAYMLLSIIGELRIGTSPRPAMATRLIVPRETLIKAGWSGKIWN